jgi:hypothetical protein
MVAGAMQILGMSLMDLGRAGEAEPFLRESLELRRRALPPGHWLIASAESMLGSCLTAQRRFREAEPFLLHGFGGLKAARGDEHELTVEARRRLVRLYGTWGRPERAAVWQPRSADGRGSPSNRLNVPLPPRA